MCMYVCMYVCVYIYIYISYYIILYYTILYCIVLYCIIYTYIQRVGSCDDWIACDPSKNASGAHPEVVDPHQAKQKQENLFNTQKNRSWASLVITT